MNRNFPDFMIFPFTGLVLALASFLPLPPGLASEVDANPKKHDSAKVFLGEGKVHRVPQKHRERIASELEQPIHDDRGTWQRQAVVQWAESTDLSWRDKSSHNTRWLAQQLAATERDTRRAASEPAASEPLASEPPDWAADAIFYQIFPERFRNGDPSNDPNRESLEFPEIIPSAWRITAWTSDWYDRDVWERELGDDFYEHGVFHRRYGGDLQGVLDKLDYLQDLGVNVLYFNPVFYARSLHKYDGNSFHHIDPHFGPDPAGDLAQFRRETSDSATWKWTAADRLFLKLVRTAHQRGMRVILDGVFNHSGRDFFAFDDLRRNQQRSLYTDWYTVKSFDDPETAEDEFAYVGWWGVDTLPEFADTSDGSDLQPGPKRYIFDATRRWMDPNGDGNGADGIDGWRLDVANEVPDLFWQGWHRLVRQLNPTAYTVAEIWEDAGSYLARCGFTATMNYHGFAFPVKGFLIDGRLSPSAFVRQLSQRRATHVPETQRVLQNLIDSHDTDRVASMIVNAPQAGVAYLRPERHDYDVGERVSPRNAADYEVHRPTRRDRKIQRLVTLFQMTYVGAPMVYYGTEAGMWGADDPCDRMPMVWPKLQFDPQANDPRGRPRPVDAISFDALLHDFYRRVIRLRRTHAALRRGTCSVLLADDPRNSLVLLRSNTEERLIVAINRSDTVQDLEIPIAAVITDHDQAGRVPSCEMILSTSDQPRARPLRLKARDGAWQLKLPALEGVVLDVRRQAFGSDSAGPLDRLRNRSVQYVAISPRAVPLLRNRYERIFDQSKQRVAKKHLHRHWNPCRPPIGSYRRIRSLLGCDQISKYPDLSASRRTWMIGSWACSFLELNSGSRRTDA